MAVQAVPPQTQTLVTGEELLAMGDIGPCELIEGRVVLMSPTGLRHGRHEIRFGKHLDDFVSQHNLGVVAVGEVGIYIRRNPDTVRAADVAFISHTRLAQQKQPSGFLEIAPELVVEIMSPDDRWSEVKQKLREYFSIGVKLIWVADPSDRTVHVYRSLTDVREFTETDMLTGDDVLPGFSVPVPGLFED